MEYRTTGKGVLEKQTETKDYDMPVALHGVYYTIAEAAERLGYAGQSSIRQGCINGTIPAHKLGNTWIIEEKTLQAIAKLPVKPQGNRGLARK